MLARAPMGRFVQPVEVTAATACLLTGNAGSINGICMPVDGRFLIN